MVRAAAVVAALAVGALALGGCGYGGSLAQREVVVIFGAGATQAEHVAAQRNCSGFPEASPEPIAPSQYASTNANNVRFRVDGASDAQLAALYGCLQKQKGVIGVNIPDTTGF